MNLIIIIIIIIIPTPTHHTPAHTHTHAHTPTTPHTHTPTHTPNKPPRTHPSPLVWCCLLLSPYGGAAVLPFVFFCFFQKCCFVFGGSFFSFNIFVELLTFGKVSWRNEDLNRNSVWPRRVRQINPKSLALEPPPPHKPTPPYSLWIPLSGPTSHLTSPFIKLLLPPPPPPRCTYRRWAHGSPLGPIDPKVMPSQMVETTSWCEAVYRGHVGVTQRVPWRHSSMLARKRLLCLSKGYWVAWCSTWVCASRYRGKVMLSYLVRSPFVDGSAGGRISVLPARQANAVGAKFCEVFADVLLLCEVESMQRGRERMIPQCGPDLPTHASVARQTSHFRKRLECVGSKESPEVLARKSHTPFLFGKRRDHLSRWWSRLLTGCSFVVWARRYQTVWVRGRGFQRVREGRVRGERRGGRFKGRGSGSKRGGRGGEGGGEGGGQESGGFQGEEGGLHDDGGAFEEGRLPRGRDGGEGLLRRRKGAQSIYELQQSVVSYQISFINVRSFENHDPFVTEEVQNKYKEYDWIYISIMICLIDRSQTIIYTCMYDEKLEVSIFTFLNEYWSQKVEDDILTFEL